MLDVIEIFHSIQGESTRAGLPCAFVRLAGCNLHCRYCDTQYAREEGTRRAVEDVVAQVHALGVPLTEITGGEPLLQAQTPELAELLADLGHTVLVETNGTVPLPKERRFHTIIDWKTPGSGHQDSFHRRNLPRLREGDEIKFVVCDRADFDWAVERLGAIPPRIPVLFSPASTLPSPRLLARWILDARIHVRLQIQIHKVLWPDAARGV